MESPWAESKYPINSRSSCRFNTKWAFMSNAGHVSKRELRQEVTNPLCNIRYASSIPGLAPFLVQKRKVPYLIPHAFVTFSAADTHWIDFHNLIEKKKAYMLGHPVVDLKGLPEREAQLPIFNQFEWQFRGSGHLHGFLWIENAGDRLRLETFWTNNICILTLLHYLVTLFRISNVVTWYTTIEPFRHCRKRW